MLTKENYRKFTPYYGTYVNISKLFTIYPDLCEFIVIYSKLLFIYKKFYNTLRSIFFYYFMYNITLLTEIFSSGYITSVLDILSLVAILCGILVIISKNPIVSVLFLIGLFLSIASFLSMLSLTFIGLSYLLVYVGAVSILFLFILMLINVRGSELLSNTSNSIPLAIIISILFYYTVRQILPYSIYNYTALVNTHNNITHIDYSTYLNNLFKLSNAGLDNKEIYYATSPI